jgi:hypothetical protein
MIGIPLILDLDRTEDEIALKGSRQGGVNKTQIHVNKH